MAFIVQKMVLWNLNRWNKKELVTGTQEIHLKEIVKCSGENTSATTGIILSEPKPWA